MQAQCVLKRTQTLDISILLHPCTAWLCEAGGLVCSVSLGFGKQVRTRFTARGDELSARICSVTCVCSKTLQSYIGCLG